MLLLFSACSGREKMLGKAITERDSLPVLDTRGVTSLVSDSGVTRYRINTEEWLVFDRKEPPYWAFEKGVYLRNWIQSFKWKQVSKPIRLIFIIKRNYGS